MTWKFFGKVQFPHSFGRIEQNYAENVPFQEIMWNYGILCSDYLWLLLWFRVRRVICAYHLDHKLCLLKNTIFGQWTKSLTKFVIQLLIVAFISHFSWVFENNVVITLIFTQRADESFLLFPSFSLFYWRLLYARLNNHCEAWSYKEMMKKKMKSFYVNYLK